MATTTTSTSTSTVPKLSDSAAPGSAPTGSSNTQSGMPAAPNRLLESLQRDGFVHIPSLISPAQLQALRQVSSHITSLTRAGQWPYFRTVPKQFPPWPKEVPPASEGSIWGVQHLLHPEAPGRSEFARLYFSDEILDVVKQLLLPDLSPADSSSSSSADSSLVMELFNLLVSPTHHPFELIWHRDDVRPDLSPAEELAQLHAKSPRGRQSHAQYNLALYDDDSLVVVPGSHRRARTDTERNADPKAAQLPGMKVVKMRPGDCVFYDSNILHRGVYDAVDPEKGETGRFTLHGSVSLAGHGRERARNVLQHGVGMWIGREDAGFSEALGGGKLGERAEGMRRRLAEMGSGEDLGYSLEG